MKHTTLILLICTLFSYKNVVVASPSPSSFLHPKSAVQSNNPPIYYSESPEYLKALLKRVTENRRSADEDTLDMASVSMGMIILGYSPEVLGTTKMELFLLARKVCIKSLKYSLQKIESGKLNAEDQKIEISDVKDSIIVYGITPEEINTTKDKLENLLK